MKVALVEGEGCVWVVELGATAEGDRTLATGAAEVTAPADLLPSPAAAESRPTRLPSRRRSR
jgi:hypothetical protein